MQDCFGKIYPIGDFWDSEFCPSSRILKERVPGTGSVSVHGLNGGQAPTVLGPLERAYLSHWTIEFRFTDLTCPTIETISF
jgi:hypothetical protein